MAQQQFVVLHIEKRMEVSAVLERHIDRKEVKYVGGVRQESTFIPDNADSSRTHLNKELVSRVGTDDATGKSRTLTINQAIRERIDAAGIKVRKGQNTALEIILSGSHETMVAMTPEELERWTNETMDWCARQWGKENLVSATLHCDEETPHIHLIVVPIVKGQSRRSASRSKKQENEGKVSKKYNIDHNKERLSANEVYTKPRLGKYWDSYAKEVGEHFGLVRGIPAEPGSKKRHQSSIEYNRNLERKKQEQESVIVGLKSKEAFLESNVSNLERKNRQLKNQNETLQNEKQNLEGTNKVLQSEYDKQKQIIDTQKLELVEQGKHLSAIKEEIKESEEKKKLSKNFTDDIFAVGGKLFGVGKIANAEQERDNAMRELDVARSKLREMEAKFNEAIKNAKQEESVKNSRQIADLQKELESYKKRINDAEGELAKIKEWNPNMQNLSQSIETMRKAGMTNNQIQKVIKYGSLENAQVSFYYNWKQYQATATVSLGKSTNGQTYVWFNDKRYDLFSIDEGQKLQKGLSRGMKR